MCKEKNSGEFKELREILFNAMPEIGHDCFTIHQQIDFYWNLIVGRKISEVSQVQRFEDNTLYIKVINEDWEKALIPLKQKIIDQINQCSDKINISKIIMKKSKISFSRKIEANCHTKIQKELQTPYTKSLPKKDIFQMIKDPELSQALQRLEGKFRFFSIIFGLSCWALITNCVSSPTTKTSVLIDLDKAYSVEEIKKRNSQNVESEFRDPRAYFHFLMALQAQRQWNLQKAIFHFQKVVEHDSKTEEFHVFLARLYLMTGQFDQLLALCDRGLEKFPKNSQLALIAADVSSALGKNNQALSYLEKGIENQEEKLTNNYLLAGLIYLKNKNYSQAKEMLVKLTHVNPTNPLGFHYLGILYGHLQKWEKAQKTLEYGTNLKPSFKKSREFLAWVFENQGKLEKAENEYLKLQNQDPDKNQYETEIKRLKSIRKTGFRATLLGPKPKDSSVHLKLGIMYYEQSNYGEALEELNLFLAEEQSEETKAVHLLIARIFEVYKRYPEAINELEAILKMAPKSVEILLQIARMHNLNKNSKKTIQVLHRAVQLAPKRDELHHSLSLAYMSQNQYALAIRHIRQAIDLNPAQDAYFFELGSLLERTGAYEKAISTMKQVIELNPNHSNAHNFIGYMYALQGQYLDLAVVHLEKALSIQPQNGYFLDSLGWVYHKKGEHHKALAEIQKAMIYTEPDPVLYDHLGDVYYSLKNYGEANRAWKISLSLTQRKMKEKEGLGELPNLQGLQEKIGKVRQILNSSF